MNIKHVGNKLKFYSARSVLNTPVQSSLDIGLSENDTSAGKRVKIELQPFAQAIDLASKLASDVFGMEVNCVNIEPAKNSVIGTDGAKLVVIPVDVSELEYQLLIDKKTVNALLDAVLLHLLESEYDTRSDGLAA